MRKLLLLCLVLAGACGDDRATPDAANGAGEAGVAAGDGAAAPADAAADASAGAVDGAGAAPAPLDAAASPDALAADAAVADVASLPGTPPDGATNALVLTNLELSLLPINSLRGSARGVDTRTGLCAEIVWYIHDARARRLCGFNDAGITVPYVFLGQGDCSGVHYNGNVQVLDARGCAQFGVAAGTHSVDVAVDVRSDLFTGTIYAKGP